MALNIISCRLPSGDTPVCGVPLEPYVLCRKDNNTTATADEIPEEGASSSRFSLRYRWYRSVVQRSGAVCWIHPDREANLQCILCIRCKVDIRKSYHCSTGCLRQHWSYHKELHDQKKQNGQLENGYSGDLNSKSATTHSNGGETWIEVGRDRQYTPTTDDVGSILKNEVVPLDTASAYPELGKPTSVLTARVRPAPQPPKRSLVELKPTNSIGPSRFTALTYNLLADLYATMTAGQHSHCQPWMLAWGYRKQNLLKELIAYQADILCLQEVQSNHFLDFLAPKLQEVGYSAIYKKKTTEIYAGNSYAIDGCATFFRRERFALVKKYEVEFNKAALSLSDALSSDQRQGALNRLLKDNVALIAVLEALDSPEKQGSNRRQLICVANTHIHANPELSDVKLWQVHTLLKGLEKIAASADIPMLVAGDFNSVPGSAAHSLLVNNNVDASHPELQNDPLGILRPANKLRHHLPLASAYAAAAEGRDLAPAAQRLRQRMDARHREPKFTSMSKDFQGTLDYILYTSDSLVPTAALDLPEESEVASGDGPGLPNEHWSSDHIALLAEFAYRQETPSQADKGSSSA